MIAAKARASTLTFETVLTADPETAVGLVAAALTMKQAIASGAFLGDAGVLRRTFPGAEYG